MHQIRLYRDVDIQATLLPNRFIDEYMPNANGEFVKLYIYLLRCLGKGMEEIPIDYLADHLLCTEGDILRALRYWEKQSLLFLSVEQDGSITSVQFSGFPEKSSAAQKQERPLQPIPETMPSAREFEAGNTDTAANAKSQEPALTGTGSLLQEPDFLADQAEATEFYGTAERLEQLMQNEDVQQILFIAEQYLGKTLSPIETDKLIYFYDQLKMSVDLIDYLIEYCVGRGHRSIRYIETVALSWKDDGIDTVEKAKKSSFSGRKEYFSILRALGIQGRSPVESEIRFMDKWLDEYHFPLSLIYEACNRTIIQTGQPSFPYTDKILSDWNSSGASSLDDIARLDATHQMARPKKPAKGERPPAQGTPAKGAGRFNNFSQREYDYSDVEKQLLHLNN